MFRVAKLVNVPRAKAAMHAKRRMKLLEHGICPRPSTEASCDAHSAMIGAGEGCILGTRLDRRVSVFGGWPTCREG
eukprot:scaffold274084_cov16-Prasinocladus_malaysianus.AAC.2